MGVNKKKKRKILTSEKITHTHTQKIISSAIIVLTHWTIPLMHFYSNTVMTFIFNKKKIRKKKYSTCRHHLLLSHSKGAFQYPPPPFFFMHIYWRLTLHQLDPILWAILYYKATWSRAYTPLKSIHTYI